jgi:Zn-dependent protease with chaperone function
LPAAPSIARRAALAIALLVGFYVLAIGIAGLLLLVAYEVGSEAISHNTFGTMKLVFFCVVGAGIILWSILPRFDHFVAPGPQLTQQDQPELFEMIDSLSQATGEAMPTGVYVIPEVNAWVAQRGGILGIGSRRVMGLGLPLMQILSVTQLRAVLAHEFGHYYGGDTRLGPLVYNMRGAIGRTVYNLARRNSILYKPFAWYGSGALRLTQGVSRQQEHAADELAARTVGAKALADALSSIHSGAIAYLPYIQQEVQPLLRLSVRPAFATGFAQFLAAPRIEKVVAEETAREIAEGKADPYDSHPPLRERLAELAKLSQGVTNETDVPATSLLRNLDALEAELLASATGKSEIKNWRSVDWEKVGEEVYLPNWKKAAKEHNAGLLGVHPAEFPLIAGDLAAFGRRIASKTELPSKEVLAQKAIEAVGSAFAITLYRHGWTLRADPGEPFRFFRGDIRMEPFSVLNKLQSGELSRDGWEQQCRDAGIADWDLGTPSSATN